MRLSPGTSIHSYEIVSFLGAGGMGEVYRARDLRLGRDVALKFLNEGLANHTGREARAIAAINHPNVCQIYDVGPDYLVMEYLGGSAPQGPLSLAEALRICDQVAEGLAAAHECGIVHRDLKPGNLRVTPDGTVKILDFGLAQVDAPRKDARHQTDAPQSEDTESTITIGRPLTGTVAYMAPEQVRGKNVDKRTDIWAFGVTLYQLLTGALPFKGDTAGEMLGSILRDEPDWERVPATVRPLLHHCLEKDPRKRLRDISDAKLLLHSQENSLPSRARRWLPWAACAAVLELALLAYILWPTNQPTDTYRFEFSPPPNVQFENYLALSPDGRKVAFVTNDGSNGQLWVRSLDSLNSKLIAHYPNDAEAFPFWSPDGRQIAWFSESKLRRVDVSGGSVETVCELPGIAMGGTWNQAGEILFGTKEAGIFRVRLADGTPEPVTRLDPSQDEIGHEFPHFLPDGVHFLYVRRSPAPHHGGVYVGSTSFDPGTAPRRILAEQHAVSFLPGRSPRSGYLLFATDAGLVAQAFHTGSFTVNGPTVPLASPVGLSPDASYGYFSASAKGTLAYTPGIQHDDRQLMWFDASGINELAGDLGDSAELSLAPNGWSGATTSAGSGGPDIHLFDLHQHSRTRLTFRPGAHAPVWFPDGKEIAFADVYGNLLRKRASGASDPEPLLRSNTTKTANAFSTDGQYLLFTTVNPGTKADLFVLPMSEGGKARPFVATTAQEGQGVFSPDGRFVAYVSNESGQNEVYVRSFPEGTGHWQISEHGGTDPLWSRDNKTIYFVTSDGALYAVNISTAGDFRTGVPKMAVSKGFLPSRHYVDGRNYDVDARGRILAITNAKGIRNPPLVVEVNGLASKLP